MAKAKNKVIEGEYKNYSIINISKEVYLFKDSFNKDKALLFNVKTIKSIELLNQVQSQDTSSGIARGIVGGALLGGAGLVAGTNLAKASSINLFTVIFEDNKKSLIEVDAKIFDVLFSLKWKIENTPQEELLRQIEEIKQKEEKKNREKLQNEELFNKFNSKIYNTFAPIFNFIRLALGHFFSIIFLILAFSEMPKSLVLLITAMICQPQISKKFEIIINEKYNSVINKENNNKSKNLFVALKVFIIICTMFLFGLLLSNTTETKNTTDIQQKQTYVQTQTNNIKITNTNQVGKMIIL